jgi:lysine-specific demethylase 3
VINTSTLEVHRISLKDFFDGFSNVNERPRNENGDPMVLKLKDWPTTWDFKEKLPQWLDFTW